ncbi:hypothetical protein H5410_032554 [Solanum commersonii]|uniref:RRM domain-containing protein n=1 Tax=Solanum commersonii TaxID=4109 RepID=A0A9J5YN86_SOLCO|nr:hypothetical protein H5410_032554 [Solanum commersonii]
MFMNEHTSREEHEHEYAEMVDAVEDAEHHEIAKERLKRKEFEMYIGGLDKDAVEDDLRKIFSQVGEVTKVKLLMNPLTKKNKGFAFLRFNLQEWNKLNDYQRCSLLDKICVLTYQLPGEWQEMWCFPSQDSETLFLGSICKSWTKEARCGGYTIVARHNKSAMNWINEIQWAENT